MYTYQDTFRVSSLLPSATSEISADPTSAPVVATISNLLIEKFNPDDTACRDASPFDLHGTPAELDAPLSFPARVIGQRPGQFLVIGIGSDKGLDFIARTEGPLVGLLSLDVLVVAR